MAFRRPVVALLTIAFAATSWSQEPPAAPAAPKPEDAGQEPKPEHKHGPSGREGERRDGKPGYPPPPGWNSDGKGRPDWRGDRGDRDRWKRENLTPEQMTERAMRDLEKLTPEQRNEVWRSVWAVLNLPPEKRQELIGSHEEKRKKVREEIDRTLQSTGIKLADDQKRKFFYRYFSGRREIEERLQKEGEERRQVLMKEFDEKLKQEFGSVQSAEQQAGPK
jgi:hypothetical protein